jgi:phage tail sheath protein FI
VIEAGQVICEIGISPVKPAEFVVFRLSQFSGGEGSAVSE